MEGGAGQVDLNMASVEALIQLSGIGPALAQRIVAARPLKNVDDLVRVQGIGPHTLERLRPFVSVSAGDGGPPAAGPVGETLDAEGARVELKARAPETVPLPAPVPEQAEEVDEMEDREDVLKSEQGGAADAGAVEAEVLEAEAFKVEGTEEHVVPWEEEPIPGLDEEIPFADQGTPGEDVVRAAEAAPERKRPAVTRARVRGMALLSIVLATLLATLLTLAILSYLNGGQLQYVTPARFAELSARAEGLEAQAGVLAQDVEGLRKRLDNLEALSGRLSTVEQATERVQADLKAAAGEVEKLAAQASDLETQAAGLAQRAEEVEARVGTLEAQGSRAQAFLEGLAELMNTLFPPKESTP